MTPLILFVSICSLAASRSKQWDPLISGRE